MRALLYLIALVLLPFGAQAKIPSGGTCACVARTSTPTISPGQATYTTAQTMTLADAAVGSTIYYTLNGSAPSTSSPIYTAPFLVSVTTTVKAMATAPGYAQSLVNTVVITIQTQAPQPTFSPVDGTYASAQTIALACAIASPSIYYTIDGTTPTYPITGTTVLYTGAISVGITTTIKALCRSASFTNSAVVSSTYTITGSASTCPVPIGSVGTLNASTVNRVGIAPWLVWFNATATSDSSIAANRTTFTDVTYTWTFGDTGASGTGTWAYGSNAGNNSKNYATGAVAAHLYELVDLSGDTTYQPQVSAQDKAGNSATCLLPTVTAYDPAGANGFPGTATTCIAATTTPVAGSGGCPTGAAVQMQPNANAALSGDLSGRRILFKCADQFTINAVQTHGLTYRIDAYGSCTGNPAAAQGTSGYPSFTDTGTTGEIVIGTGSASVAANDFTISHLDLEGSGSGNYEQGIQPQAGYNFTQGAFNSLYINANSACLQYFSSIQWGTLNSVCTGMRLMVAMFVNDSENQCVNGSHSYNCGAGPGQPVYVGVNYNALLGNYASGAGAIGTNDTETFRVSACRLCIFSNNTFTTAYRGGATFKMHNGQPGSQAEWIGQYTELIEVSDNLYIGTSGAQQVEICPQNIQTDERLANIVFERNIVAGSNGGIARICAMNAVARDNVFNGVVSGAMPYGVVFSRRGVEYGYIPSGMSVTTCTSGSNSGYNYCSGNSGAPFNGSAPQYDDAFNNTFYGVSTAGVGFVPDTWIQAANQSTAINNMAYKSGGGIATVSNSGTGNTTTPNTANGSTGSSPAFVNAGGAPDVIASYQPTANYSGATGVPVIYDGNLSSGAPFGVLWPPTWDLGAIHH